MWGHTNIRLGHTLARRSLAFLEEDTHRDTHSHATEKKQGSTNKSECKASFDISIVV